MSEEQTTEETVETDENQVVDSSTTDGANEIPSEEAGEEKKNGVQVRIDELTAQKYKDREEIAYWKGQAEAQSRQPAQPAVKPEPVQAEKPLDPDDFESNEAYLKAFTDDLTDKVEKRFNTQKVADSQREVATRRESQFTEAAKDENMPDFDTIARNPNLPVTQTMVDAMEGENFSKILYHLGKNPAEAARISKLTTVKAAMEIAKIEVGITTIPKQKKKSNTPEPVSTLNGGGKSIQKDITKMSGKERRAQWEADRLKRLESGLG